MPFGAISPHLLDNYLGVFDLNKAATILVILLRAIKHTLFQPVSVVSGVFYEKILHRIIRISV